MAELQGGFVCRANAVGDACAIEGVADQVQAPHARRLSDTTRANATKALQLRIIAPPPRPPPPPPEVTTTKQKKAQGCTAGTGGAMWALLAVVLPALRRRRG